MTEETPNYPWLKSYPDGVDWHASIKASPLHAILDDAVAKYPNHTCLEFLGRKYSYKEVGEMVAKVAKGLRERGVGKGVKVGLFLPNCPFFVISYYAILKAGGTVVNYNPLYSIRELQHQIDDSDTSIMITLNLQTFYYKMMTLLRSTRMEMLIIADMADMLPLGKRMLFKWKHEDEIAQVPYDVKKVPFAALLNNDGVMQTVRTDPEKDCAVLQYTGGTTGIPKGTMLTHANLFANVHQAGSWFHGFEEGKERMMGVLPLFHVFAMTVVMNLSLHKGACIILEPRFELQKMLADISQKKATLLPGVPTIFVAISNALEQQKYKLSSLKVCISGGAPLPKEVKEKFEQLSGCKIVEGYGLTESSPVVTVNPISDKNKAGSVGVPLPQTVVEIRDVEKSDKVLGKGKIGEICVSGPQVMQGYWNNEKETEQTLRGKRLHTGDVGYMDDEGYVFIVDRLKEVIIAGGYKIYPRNVEEVIYQHPDVAETAVVGIPDAYKGQAVRAYIVCKSERRLTAEDIKQFLQGKLAPFEIPATVEFLPELPKTIVGKTSKKALLSKEPKPEHT